MTRQLVGIIIIVLVACFSFGPLQADTLWTPRLDLIGSFNDNIDFNRTNPEEDFVYLVGPGLKFNYNQERTIIDADGSVMFRRYQDNDDLNDQIYDFKISANTQPTERFSLPFYYSIIKDTTLDSELQEVGRIFSREDRLSQRFQISPSFNINERWRIGFFGGYRNVTYDSQTKVDYSVVDLGMPLRWRMASQQDIFYMSLGWNYIESDTNRSTSPNFRIGWTHETTERLDSDLFIGVRNTENEDLTTNETTSKWSWLAGLNLDYLFPKGKYEIDFQHDLRYTADGYLLNVSNLKMRFRWNFTQRMGALLDGRFIYSYDAGSDRDNPDNPGYYFEIGADLFYHLTEHHDLFIRYDYSQDYEEEDVSNPRAERNRIGAGIRLNFPL